MRCFPSLILLIMVLGSSFGCSGKQPPPLFPVKGKVVKAGKAISGGTVQFRSTTEAGVTTLGEVDTNGAFELSSLFDSRRFPGAPAGNHDVLVVYTPTEGNRSPTPVELGSVTVEAKDNVFELDLDKAKPSP